MVDEFPGNSQRKVPRDQAPKKTSDISPEDKEIRRVTKGEVTRRKMPVGKRFKQFFFGRDLKTVVGYVTKEVILPSGRDLIADAGREVLDGVIYRGEGGPRRHRSRGSSRYWTPPSQSPQSRPAWRREESSSREVSQRARATHDFDEIVFDTRGEAEEVLEQLFEIISRYDQASVSDFYAMVGARDNFTDRAYGWTDLRGVKVSRVRGGGYVLNLPRPEQLD